jgi:hypothetical protein
LCVKAGRKEPNGSGSWRASWRCRAHPDVHVCKSRDRPCMAEHLANVASGSWHGQMSPPRSTDFNRFICLLLKLSTQTLLQSSMLGHDLYE